MKRYTLPAIILFVSLLFGCKGTDKTYPASVSYTDVSKLVEEGNRFLEAGDLTGASERFCEAMELNPKEISARIGAARVQTERMNYESAANSLMMAARIQPDNHEIYEAYLQLGEASGSEAYYRQLITLARNYQQDWFFDEYIPPAPMTDTDPGNYHERTMVALSPPQDSQIMFSLNTEKEYKNFTVYTKPVRLMRGYNEIRAYSVKNGVPGEIVTWEYECEYAPEVITFQDPVVEQMVRVALDRPEGEITDVDCEDIHGLDSYMLSNHNGSDDGEDQQIHTLEDLKWMPYMDYITLNKQTEITDWTPLSQTGITELDLAGCGLENLEFIKDMPSLNYIYVSNNQIQDISIFNEVDGIMGIRIDGNPVEDLTPVFRQKQLRHLGFSGKQISDISQITSLEYLEYLTILDGEGLDFGQLDKLKNLQTLYLNNCGLTDISFVSSLSKLKSLNLNFNDITDVTPVTSLHNLTRLVLNNNGRLSEIDVISGLSRLETLSLYYTAVSDEAVDKLSTALPSCNINN